MASAQSIAKQSGLNPVQCGGCGNKINTKDAMDAFYKMILKKVAEGERVTLPGIGTFYAREMKGRTLNSPVLPGGQVDFPDQMILRFRAAGEARRVLNAEDENKSKTSKKKAAAKKDGGEKKSKKTAASKKKAAKKAGKKQAA